MDAKDRLKIVLIKLSHNRVSCNRTIPYRVVAGVNLPLQSLPLLLLLLPLLQWRTVTRSSMHGRIWKDNSGRKDVFVGVHRSGMVKMDSTTAATNIYLLNAAVLSMC